MKNKFHFDEQLHSYLEFVAAKARRDYYLTHEGAMERSVAAQRESLEQAAAIHPLEVALDYATGDLIAITKVGQMIDKLNSLPPGFKPKGVYIETVQLSNVYDPDRHLICKDSPVLRLPGGMKFAYRTSLPIVTTSKSQETGNLTKYNAVYSSDFTAEQIEEIRRITAALDD